MLKTDQIACDCAVRDTLPARLQKLVIPAEFVDRERERLRIRHQLSTSKAIAMGVVIVLAIFAVVFGRSAFAGVADWLQIIKLVLTFVLIMGLVQFVDWIFYRVENHRLSQWNQKMKFVR